MLVGYPIWRPNTQNHHRSACRWCDDSRGWESGVRVIVRVYRVNAFGWGIRPGWVGYTSGKDFELCPGSWFGVAIGAGQR
jgi:hypothetical protein